MNALHAVQNSIFYEGARAFFILTGIAVAVAGIALTIFYSSFIALEMVAISLKVAKYTAMVAGCSMIAAVISATVYHIFSKVKARVELLRAPASGP